MSFDTECFSLVACEEKLLSDRWFEEYKSKAKFRHLL